MSSSVGAGLSDSVTFGSCLVNVEPIDLRDELRLGVQFRLALAPVVVGPPLARELPHQRERHALRVVDDRLAIAIPQRLEDNAFKVVPRPRFARRLSVHADRERKEANSLPLQRITHLGTCGKTRVVPQNRRPRPELRS